MNYYELAEAGFPHFLVWTDPQSGESHHITRGYVRDDDGSVFGWFANGVPGIFRLSDCRTA